MVCGRTFHISYHLACNLQPTLQRRSTYANLAANPSILLSVFLPNVLLGLLIPSIAEEPGWRGFALPRMQKYYRPIIATLVLGLLHGIWHLPALFTPMLGPFTLNGFIIFVITAAGGTFIYTWVFNHTRDSIWMAMLLHSSSNAASKLVSELLPKDLELTGWLKLLDGGWTNAITFTIVALFLLIPTRGKLGYHRDQEM
jgi:membrane protease YdiL (CAAX protease family)